jgi:RNA recognition motif-containing protein
LKDLFREKVGDIMFCEVFEKDGKSLGSAAMEFRTVTDAERAVEIMHHYELDGRKISVRLDNEGYKTKQAKEAANSNSNRNDSKSSSNNNGLFDTSSQAAALALALSSLNSSNLLSNNGTQNSLLSNLGNLLQLNNPLTSNLVVTSSLMNGANPSVQQNSMLNMIASQLKVEGPVTNRLFVASLDYKVNEDKIKEVFGLAGVVQSVSLFKDKDGRSRGMAVVEYESPLEALNAVAMFNHQQLMDRQMTVRFDTKPPKDDDNIKSTTPSNQAKLPLGLKSIGTGLTNLLPKSASNFSNNLTQIGGLSSLSNINSTNDLTSGLGINLNGSGLGTLINF